MVKNLSPINIKTTTYKLYRSFMYKLLRISISYVVMNTYKFYS